MYQALYRKWRPQTFDDVVGQEHITLTLKRQVATDRLSHAYLFVGTRGTGKTTCAKILARAVNCEHPENGNPCNRCQSCRGILDGSVLDVVELDAASNNKVDDVRALQDEAIFSPASVKKRVYIIDEVHMLSTAAFNALLKILEEPPEHLLFILCTTELHKVLPTIISRCQRHSFKRIEPGAIAQRLLFVAKNERIDLSEDAAELLARMADGGMRDALSLLDQCSARETIDTEAVYSSLGLAGSRRIEELLTALCDHKAETALTLFDRMWRDGKDPAGILGELGDLMRDILILKVAPKSGSALVSGVYDKNAIERFAAKMSGSDLMDAMTAIRGADLSGTNPRRAAELCLVSIAVPETGESLSALRSRVSKLEAAIQSGVSVFPISDATPEPLAHEPDPLPADGEELPWFTDEDAPPEEPFYEPPEPTPQVKTEPKPKPKQEPKPEPDKAAKPEGGAEGSELWKSLVERLNGKMELYLYAILTSPLQSVGVLRGDVMTVYLDTPFSKLMLDTAETADLMRRELSAMLERNIQIEFIEGMPETATEPDRSKLEALRRFSNVKFE